MFLRGGDTAAQQQVFHSWLWPQLAQSKQRAPITIRRALLRTAYRASQLSGYTSAQRRSRRAPVVATAWPDWRRARRAAAPRWVTLW